MRVRFGFVAFGWWAFPLWIIVGLCWLVYFVLRATFFVVLWLIAFLAPIFAAGAVDALGRWDAKLVDRLETAEQRHDNGKEKRQESAAYSTLYDNPHPSSYRS